MAQPSFSLWRSSCSQAAVETRDFFFSLARCAGRWIWETRRESRWSPSPSRWPAFSRSRRGGVGVIGYHLFSFASPTVFCICESRGAPFPMRLRRALDAHAVLV
ncbi:hypothetical protein DEO72_LG10g388 [Vigna unguiculata]|uniref:Uncharacterized protein n=1 Tax=Vigna unguiculata TaxID=3917 RepID=A0A4D6N9K0_VIGUN|nr:hypothetical protein DEO72_LG10g388 [Vigna unguiculata]